MSQLLSFQTYVEHVKLQAILDQIKHTGYQCWIHIYSSLFWIISVHIDNWKLKRNQDDTLSTINNLTFAAEGTLHQNQFAAKVPSKLKCKMEKRKSSAPIHRHCDPSPPQFIKEPSKKPSFLLLKGQMLSWKQKRKWQYEEPFQMNMAAGNHDSKRTFFLRRASVSNSIHSTDTSSSSSIESPKSILKSFSLKLKRQPSFIQDKPRRLSLASFRRKNSSSLDINSHGVH